MCIQAYDEGRGPKKLAVCIVMELCEMGDVTAYLKVHRQTDTHTHTPARACTYTNTHT